MNATSQQPGMGPTDVADAPAPAHQSKIWQSSDLHFPVLTNYVKTTMFIAFPI